MRDVQRQHRNNEVRTGRIVVGELTAKDEAPKEGDKFIICTLPRGVALTKVIAMSVGAGDADFKVTAGDLFDIEVTPTESKADTDDTMKDKVTTEATQVTVEIKSDVKTGSVQVGIEYIDLNTVTGDRVSAVEA